jgi:hypothetical protein
MRAVEEALSRVGVVASANCSEEVERGTKEAVSSSLRRAGARCASVASRHREGHGIRNRERGEAPQTTRGGDPREARGAGRRTSAVLRGPEALTRPRAKLRRRVSAKARAAWKAQGRHLGAVRQLSAANREKVKAIREKNGIAAIAAAKKMAR